MRYFYYLFFILIFISCINDDEIEQESTVENDILEIRYKGYYQVFFGEPYQDDTYSNITVTIVTEEVSSTETIELLKVNAYSNGSTEDYISFKVLPNVIGNEVLYNDNFSFRSFGATYFPSDLNFNVLVNNNEEFNANFSGELEHWYEGEQRYVHLDISSASISFLR